MPRDTRHVPVDLRVRRNRAWAAGLGGGEGLGGKPTVAPIDDACPEPVMTAAAWGACFMHPHKEGIMVSSSLVPGTTVRAIDEVELPMAGLPMEP
jgi:hypothetical protein